MENNLRIEMLRQMTTSQLQALVRDDFDCYQKGIDNDQEFIKEVLEILAERNTNKLTEDQKAAKISEIISQAEQNPISMPQLPVQKRSKANLGKVIYQRCLRIAAIICVVILTVAVAIPTVGLAVGPERFIQWTDDTLSLIFFGTHSNEPITGDPCSSWRYVRELAETITEDPLVPQWLPEGYLLNNINIQPLPQNNKLVATFIRGNSELIFDVMPIVAESEICLTEKSLSSAESFEISEQTFYLFSNNKRYICTWETINAAYCMSGDCLPEEMKKIIASIFE